MTSSEGKGFRGTADDSEDSFLLDLLPSDEAAQTLEGCSLEIDEQQAREIKQIVVTTLPQYLLPAEQLADQLFDSYDEGLRDALKTTVESVVKATERIGVVEVVAPLKSLLGAVNRLNPETSADPEIQLLIHDLIAEVKDVATGAGGAEPPGPVGTTLMEASRHVAGLTGPVLERLTRAGVITLDQVWMARPGELAAVTGLESDAVDSLLTGLEHHFRRPAAHCGTAQNTALHSLHAKLARALDQQVQAEAAIDEVRSETLQARLQLESLREQLKAAEESNAGLRRRLIVSREQLADKLAQVSDAASQSAAASRHLIAARRRLQEGQDRLAEAQRAHTSALSEVESLADGLSDLQARVAVLVRDASAPEHRCTPHSQERHSPD